MIEHKEHTTSQLATFIPKRGTILIDTDKKSAVIGDGVTVGGIPLAREDLNNILEVYVDNIKKIDSLATDGLAGVSNSLAYRVHEIEKHFHSFERWLGKSADQSGNDWALEDSLTEFQAVSGTGAYGADADDEAKVIGTDDAALETGGVKFDLHRIFFKELSNDTPFIIRVVWGIGTMADAITAGQYTTAMAQNNPAGNKAGGSPINIMMPRKTWGTDKIWVQAKNATNNATVDFFVGVHEYIG